VWRWRIPGDLALRGNPHGDWIMSRAPMTDFDILWLGLRRKLNDRKPLDMRDASYIMTKQ